jgi:hypothetical protein
MRDFIHRLRDFSVGSSIPSSAFTEGCIVVAISSNGARIQGRGTVPRLHPLVELTPRSSVSSGACPNILILTGMNPSLLLSAG